VLNKEEVSALKRNMYLVLDDAGLYYIVKTFSPQEHKETERRKVYISAPQNEVLRVRKIVSATHRLLDYLVTFF